MPLFPAARASVHFVLARPLCIFLLFWLSTLSLYAVAWRGGFERDFMAWLQSYHYRSFADCINGSHLNVHSFYHVTHLQLYLWTSLFGTHPIPWLLLMTGLHAAAHVLAFRFFTALFKDLGVSCAAYVAFLGVGVALVAPGAAEVVVFKAAYHYPVALISLFGILLLLRVTLVKSQRHSLLFALLAFLPTLFTLELWYATPVLTAMLVLAYRAAGVCTKGAATRAGWLLLLPMMVLGAMYLSLFKHTAGAWVPHTQATLEGAIAAPVETLGKLGALLFHVLLFGRYWPNDARSVVYDFSAHPAVAIGLAAILAAAFIIGTLRYRKSGPAMRAGTWLLGGLGLSLAMIVHFPLERLFIIYSDRWLYLTSIFQYTLAALVLMRMLRYGRAAYVAIGVYAAIAMLLTFYTAVQWRRAVRVFWGMQHSYRWTKERRPVLLLNAPSILDGAPILFANEGGEDFRDHLRFFLGKETAVPVSVVSSYNLVRWWDGAHVIVLDSTHLKVTLNQWGTWWWRNGLGAGDYETPLYRVHFNDPGHEYELTLKQPADSVVALYLKDARWHAVDFSRLGVEQWSEGK